MPDVGTSKSERSHVGYDVHELCVLLRVKCGKVNAFERKGKREDASLFIAVALET
jgi:hypothetical protein